jgi:hypothetical protein
MGQIVEKVSETEVIVNYFATGEVVIKTFLPDTPEILPPFANLED